MITVAKLRRKFYGIRANWASFLVIFGIRFQVLRFFYVWRNCYPLPSHDMRLNDVSGVIAPVPQFRPCGLWRRRRVFLSVSVVVRRIGL